MNQWCRVCVHVNGGVDVVNIDEYKYLDYAFTCPLLVTAHQPDVLYTRPM